MTKSNGSSFVQVSNREIEGMRIAVQQFKALKIRNSAGAWKTARVVGAVQAALYNLSRDRDKLIEKYGERNDAGPGYRMDPKNKEKMTEFNKEYEKLLDVQVQISASQVRPSELGEIEIPMSIFVDMFQFFDFTEVAGATPLVG